VTIAAAMREHRGFDGSEAALADLPLEDTLSAFVEVHIEQGPQLEALGVPVGVVTGIAGQARLRVEMRGEQGHAGAPLWPLALHSMFVRRSCAEHM
jgi:ureidoglycolate amidohydrolase